MVKIGKSSLSHLIFGIVAGFVGFALILLMYGYFFGVSGGEDVAIKPLGVSLIFALMFVVLLLGLCGGFLIGLYLQYHYGERKNEIPP